ncbi:hypothetical protein [Sphingomonas sp.]|uniref:hypothetical protein n=1 Tax=Sphingomonas sp. TaxID=28214 RepID=UPI003BADAB42
MHDDSKWLNRVLLDAAGMFRWIERKKGVVPVGPLISKNPYSNSWADCGISTMHRRMQRSCHSLGGSSNGVHVAMHPVTIS